MKKWEYTALSTTNRPPFPDEIADLGNAGWELCSVCKEGKLYWCYFKRPIKQEDIKKRDQFRACGICGAIYSK